MKGFIRLAIPDIATSISFSIVSCKDEYISTISCHNRVAVVVTAWLLASKLLNTAGLGLSDFQDNVGSLLI